MQILLVNEDLYTYVELLAGAASQFAMGWQSALLIGLVLGSVSSLVLFVARLIRVLLFPLLITFTFMYFHGGPSIETLPIYASLMLVLWMCTSYVTYLFRVYRNEDTDITSEDVDSYGIDRNGRAKVAPMVDL